MRKTAGEPSGGPLSVTPVRLPKVVVSVRART